MTQIRLISRRTALVVLAPVATPTAPLTLAAKV